MKKFAEKSLKGEKEREVQTLKPDYSTSQDLNDILMIEKDITSNEDHSSNDSSPKSDCEDDKIHIQRSDDTQHNIPLQENSYTPEFKMPVRRTSNLRIKLRMNKWLTSFSQRDKS